MRSFKEIMATAELHKGGSAAVEALLPKAKSTRALSGLGDDRYLSQMSLRIFQAGLKHDMVAAKWPDFENIFNQFDTYFCAMLSDEDIENLMQDRRVIRHMGKLKAIRTNAAMIRTVAQEYGSFGKFVAQWPGDDVVGLWAFLKKHGAQLGGNSGPYFLRTVGKDTFVLTNDVVAVLVAEGIVDKRPSSKKELKAAQEAFNAWKAESGRDLCEISRIVSMNSNAN